MAKKNAELESRLEAMLSWNNQKNWRKLRAEANVFIKKYDDRSEGYFYRATALRHLEQYRDAINDFDRAIELDPKNPKAYHHRGFTKYNLGKYEEAINDFDKALDIDKAFSKFIHHDRGLANEALHRYEDAIEDFDEALTGNSKKGWDKFFEGKNYLGFRRYLEAIEYFNQAIETNPGYTSAYFFRGEAKHALELYEEAIEDYDQVIKLYKYYAKAYQFRGDTKSKLGLYHEAIKDYDQAVELGLNDPRVQNNRAVAVAEVFAEQTRQELTQTYENRLAEFIDPQKIIGFHDKRITQSSLRLYGIDIYREPKQGEGIKEDRGITAGQIIKYGFWFLRYRLNYPTLYLFILWAITLIIFYCLDFLNNCNAQYPYFCSALLFFLPSLILSVPLIIWILKNYTEQGKTKDDNDSTPEAPFLGRINRGYMGHAERASSRYRYAILMVWIGVSVLFYRYYFNSSKELVEELSLQDVLLFATTLAITTSPFRFHINFIARRADEELIRLDSYIRERNMMLFWNAQRQDKNEANKAHLTAKMFDHLDKNSAAEISLQMMKSRKFNWRLNQNKKECDKADDNNKRDQTADIADLLRAIKNLTPPKAE